MPNIITNKFKIDNAKNFLDGLSANGNSTLYFFLAKASPWGIEDSPPTPIDNQENEHRVWDEVISLKKIVPTNIVNVVKRITWEKQTVYTEYDNTDPNLLDKNFYVINKDYDVYKCIDNYNGNKSTIEPTGKNLNIFTTADNYKWKYLYSVSTSDRLKFLTSNWMPVIINSDVAAVAKDGAIENIKILNGGTDYSVFSRVVVEGDGTNANILAKQNLGVIYDFTYTNNGSGFRFANAYVTDPTRSGRSANIRAIISPVGGHGSNPIKELNARYLMINVKTEYNEGFGDFPEGFTFRKLGLVKNPKSLDGKIANVSTLNGLKGITINEVAGSFNNNEYVEGVTSKANAYIVSSNVVSGNGYLRYVQSFGITDNYRTFTIGESIIGKTSGATALVANTLSSEVLKDSGDIMYIENRTPITRSTDQTDNLHLVIEF